MLLVDSSVGGTGGTVIDNVYVLDSFVEQPLQVALLTTTFSYFVTELFACVWYCIYCNIYEFYEPDYRHKTLQLTFIMWIMKFRNFWSLRLLICSKSSIVCPGTYPATGRHPVITNSPDVQHHNKQQIKYLLRSSLTRGFWTGEAIQNIFVFNKIYSQFSHTLSTISSFRFNALSTVKYSWNRRYVHSGLSMCTMTLYRMYPIFPSTDVGSAAGSIQLNV